MSVDSKVKSILNELKIEKTGVLRPDTLEFHGEKYFGYSTFDFLRRGKIHFVIYGNLDEDKSWCSIEDYFTDKSKKVFEKHRDNLLKGVKAWRKKCWSKASETALKVKDEDHILLYGDGIVRGGYSGGVTTKGMKKRGVYHESKPKKLTGVIYVTTRFDDFETLKSIYEEENIIFVPFPKYIQETISEIKGQHPYSNIILCPDFNHRKFIDSSLLPENICVKFSTADNFKEEAERYGTGHVKESLKIERDDFIIISPLGILGGNYHYYSTYSGLILDTKCKHTKDFLKSLAPNEWWLKKHPKYDKEHRIVGVNWEKAGDELRHECTLKGKFKVLNVRSSGIFLNEKDDLYVCSGRIRAGKIHKDYVHITGQSIYVPKKTRKSEIPEFSQVDDFLHSIAWDKPASAVIFLGWFLTSPFCGALEWCPHLWISGGSSSGKTWLHSHVIDPMVKDSGLFLLGGSTEGGVRQYEPGSAVPVFFDEFEQDNAKTNQRTEDFLELLRSSSKSNRKYIIVKGSAPGRAVPYKFKTMACVSSIRVNLKSEADKNRFTILEVDRHRHLKINTKVYLRSMTTLT